MYQKCVAVYSWKIKKMQQTNSFSTIIRGPLFICLSLALILCTKAPAKQTSHVFSTVFIVMWIGSLIVTINAQLLGASISIFQSLCVSKRVTALLYDMYLYYNSSSNIVTFLGIGILCLSLDSVSTGYCNIEVYMAWNTVVRFDLAKSRFSLGNASIKYLRWPICEERKKIASFVSSIFLLLAIGLVDSFVLTYNKQCKKWNQ